jgi:hypothetical protein
VAQFESTFGVELVNHGVELVLLLLLSGLAQAHLIAKTLADGDSVALLSAGVLGADSVLRWVAVVP